MGINLIDVRPKVVLPTVLWFYMLPKDILEG